MEQDTFLEDMKQLLQVQRASLEGELVRLQLVTGSDDSFSEHASLGNHMADDASELFEQEKTWTIQHHTAELLDKVVAALHKLDTGSYGFCEQCRLPIDRERLRTLPYATLCVSCKARQERA